MLDAGAENALLSVDAIEEDSMALEMDGYEVPVDTAADDVWNALVWLADG